MIFVLLIIIYYLVYQIKTTVLSCFVRQVDCSTLCDFCLLTLVRPFFFRWWRWERKLLQWLVSQQT